MDVSDLKAGLNEASKRIAEANADFKAATSSMGDWTKSTEGITAKIKQLDTVLSAQKSKLAGLKAEYDKTAESQGANSEAARDLYIRMKNQEAIVNKTQREFDNYSETLKQVEAGEIDLTQTTLKMGKAVQKAAKEVKDTGEAAKDASDGFTIAKGAVAGFIANGLTALVGACKNAITNVLGLSDATREYRRTMATVDAAAKDVGVSTDYIRDKFADLSGVFEDQDSIAEGLNNLLTAGFDEKSLDGITRGLEGAALKWKDTLKFEGLADSLQEWIGSGGANLTGNFAELLERMGYNLEDVKTKTAGMTDEQRRNYAANILNSEGLNQVSEKYREQNADMVAAQEANVRYQDTVAQMGATIEPITTKIREGFTRILEKLIELVSGVDLDAFGAKIDGVFTTFINNILPKIISGLQWLIDNADIVISGVAGIGAAFVAWKVVNIIQSATKALQGMTIAQKLLNLAMKANPIGIVISLLAALVTAFVVLWNKSESFRNFWIGLWESIKKYCSDAWKAITKWFSEAWQNIKNIWNGAGAWFAGIWNGIKNIFSNVGTWFSEKFNEAKDNIVNAFSDIKEKFLSTGKNIVKGIWEGIQSGAKWLKDKISGFAGDVSGWFKKTFKIGSPSKLMADEVGRYVGEGVGVGVIDSIPAVKKQLGKFSSFVSDNLGNIKSGLTVGTSGSIGGNMSSRGNTVVNAGMTVNYNGTLSRKQLKQLENDNYTAIKMRLRTEGAI